MSKYADLFKAYLDEREVKYTYYEATEKRNEAIKIVYGGKTRIL